MGAKRKAQTQEIEFWGHYRTHGRVGHKESSTLMQHFTVYHPLHIHILPDSTPVHYHLRA